MFNINGITGGFTSKIIMYTYIHTHCVYACIYVCIYLYTYPTLSDSFIIDSQSDFLGTTFRGIDKHLHM